MRVGMAGLAALYWPICMANGLMKHGNVEFTAAATLGENEEYIGKILGMTAQEYAVNYGVRLYTHAEEMIEKERLDCIVLISRHSKHADWVERLAPAGVKIFIPKTFATAEEEAGRIIAAERKYGIQVASGPTARFIPQIATVKKAVDDGRIGKPFAARICHHHGTMDCFHPDDWYRLPAEGGPELSLAWYGIDLILQFLGEDPGRVSAAYGSYTTAGSPFMDCGRLEMITKDGAQAQFDMYFCNRVAYPSWQMEILGPKGVLSIHRTGNDGCRTIVGYDGPNGYEELPILDDIPDWEHFWIDDFAKGRVPPITAEYAGLVTRISLAARESALAVRGTII